MNGVIIFEDLFGHFSLLTVPTNRTRDPNGPSGFPKVDKLNNTSQITRAYISQHTMYPTMYYSAHN